ncbi:SDR family NAD(P)-dependent oxidoreductase [Nocardia transvalensis]|uniref:SDR family NAD(P)-dependent oxidoreductase n=1 Tax=Nocardia transvalensis TaxID=37333 RepID=UPI001893583E|nr:SDR family NAD(P)-dependent oxidoreductase [Nocardia transvalensis]MBF6329911.1 SDR family NAD(P)-dependent oxidoreductase [Nocardia transvalensis]
MSGWFVITGASSGLGSATAKELARAGHNTILACRDPARAEAAAQEIRCAASDAQVQTVIVDLASISSVHRAAQILAEQPLAGIICNAGLQIVHGVRESADGYELTFATNHLGHFQLVTELAGGLPAGSRILVVSSDVHQGPRKSMGFPAPVWMHPKDLADVGVQRDRASGRAGRVRYATSKLANVYFAYELAERLRPRGIAVNAFNPGLMPETGLSRDYPAPMRQSYRLLAPMVRRLMPIGRSVAQSAADLAWLATAPELAEVTGRYFTGRTPVASAPASYDRQRGDLLWRTSEELVRQV